MGEMIIMRSANVGAVYAELCLTVSKALKKTPYFNYSLIPLQIMLMRIKPMIDEIDALKRLLRHPKDDIAMLIDLLRDGKVLVGKCLIIKPWNLSHKYIQVKLLIKLYNSLQHCFHTEPHILTRIRIQMAGREEWVGKSGPNADVQTPPPVDMETLNGDKKGDGPLGVISVPVQLCRRFTFAEVLSATDNFDDAFVIGRGGFGKVYKGFVNNGTTIVAIKRLDPTSKQGGKEFRMEIEMLSKFRHCHLVSLMGYYYNGCEMILVYEYMINGSMADHLHPKDEGRNANRSILSWVQRLKICIGAARGIDYLHTGTGVLQRVIHRDVKSSNILLDENWAAKVSDFGLCKIGPANQSFTHVSTCVKGTPGYCDPDYFLTHRVTRKSDVYAFGVVLLEVLSGKPALDLKLPKEQRSLVSWAKLCIQENTPHKLIDPNLKWEICSKSLEVFVKIADKCLDNTPKKRPPMAEVMTLLELALAMQTSKDSSLLDEDIFNFGNAVSTDEVNTLDVGELAEDDQGGHQNIRENESIESLQEEIDQIQEERICIDKQNNIPNLPSEVVETPHVGMIFRNVEAIKRYYSSYSKAHGFMITRSSSTSTYDGNVIYVMFACTRGCTTQNSMRTLANPLPSCKIECQAKIIASRQKDGSYKFNTVVLDHNHDLHFSEKDAQSYIDKARGLCFGLGDAEAVNKYFSRMQERNSDFFYALDVDDEYRIKNMFWADARSRATYEDFGDVVAFDTAYLTDKYEMPFATFVGVNHHGQSVLFGCGLISREDTQTFVWLFETLKLCMCRVMPKAIITDESKAIQSAVEKVFPKTRHRWCLWHIMKKVPERLSGFATYGAIKFDLHNCVYDSQSKEGFEQKWMAMIEKYKLHNNQWLRGLYEERNRWVPIYMKDYFFAGMSTTQRNESINAFFDGYAHSKTTIKQFVEQYDHALCNKIEEEKQANYQSFNSTFDCITRYPLEKQFQEAYTNSKFKEFQEEIRGMIYCLPNFVNEVNGVSKYNVRELVFEGSRLKGVQNNFDVQFNEHVCDVNCACKLFQFKGILCRHALAVLITRMVTTLPESYILPRWRKDVKRKYAFIRSSYDDTEASMVAKRLSKLCTAFYEIAPIAAEFEETFEVLMGSLTEGRSKVLHFMPSSDNDPTGVTVKSTTVDQAQENVKTTTN